MTTVILSLSDSLQAFVETQMAAKGYGDAGLFMRDLLRDAQKHHLAERRERLLIAGMESPPLSLDAGYARDLTAQLDALLTGAET